MSKIQQRGASPIKDGEQIPDNVSHGKSSLNMSYLSPNKSASITHANKPVAAPSSTNVTRLTAAVSSVKDSSQFVFVYNPQAAMAEKGLPLTSINLKNTIKNKEGGKSSAREDKNEENYDEMNAD